MIYIICGNSGSGKSTQAELLSKKANFKKIITYTTREIRNNEKDKVDYNFISIIEFKKLLEEDFFVAPTHYSFNYYGIAKSDLEKYKDSKENIVLVLDIIGIKELKKLYDNIICIYLKLNKEELINRMKKRNDSHKKIKERVDNIVDFTPVADYIIDAYKNPLEIENEIYRITKKPV